MWLHLGTVANIWEMWEERVLIAPPEDHGVLAMWATTARHRNGNPAAQTSSSVVSTHSRGGTSVSMVSVCAPRMRRCAPA
ncbi:hypothetical protein I552_2240 [Mycobacterium xenopi 3993]|nr:hypothetical protein I552_2240 [Mycobacterium xenopi 3993]